MKAVLLWTRRPVSVTTLREKIETDKPPQASKQDSHNSILQKLDVLRADGRVRFLMADWDGEKSAPSPRSYPNLLVTGLNPAWSTSRAFQTRLRESRAQ